MLSKIGALLVSAALGASGAHNVLDYGADPGGKVLSTAALQKTIDAAAEDGGATVRLPPGTYLSGALRLRSGVALELDEGATLLGSRNPKDYYLRPVDENGRETAGEPVFRNLIDGRDLHDVSIRGKGTIDGNGDAFRDETQERPKNIYFENCRRVLVEGVRLRNAGSWMQHYRFCDGVTIHGIDVYNHATFSNDGLTIDSSRNVDVSDSRVDSDDDGICLKSLSDQPVRDVRIRDCVISSHCNALKMGTESGGGFVNIDISGLTILSPQRSRKINGEQRGLAGILMAIVDGGRLEDVSVSDVKMTGVTTPIFLRLGNRGRAYGAESKAAVGTFRGVTFKNISAKGLSPLGCAIAGLPGHPIEDIAFENIDFSFEGGGDAENTERRIPERPDGYPESTMFGTLPAYGFYGRHVKGLRFSGVKLRAEKSEPRHALVFDDAEDVAINGLDLAPKPGGAEPVALRGAATNAIILENRRLK